MSVPILVVEHEPRYAERMKEALKTRPVEILFARDGEEALQVIDQRHPRLIILSSVIPRVSTADLIRQIKARPAGAAASILITVSGYTGKNPRGDAMRLGADDIIPKPFMDAFFAEKVSQLVETQARPKLTSNEIFGDLLADKPATRHVKKASQEDIEKLLEQTLTGLRVPNFQKKKSEQVTSPQAPTPSSEFRVPSSESGPGTRNPEPGTRHQLTGSGLDRLVEDTLSGLEKSIKHRPAPARTAPAPEPASPPPLEEKIMASSPVIAPAPAPSVQEEVQEESGNRFGQYTLVERIARGGMAEVWKAKMSGVEGFEKIVAIKKILPHLSDDSEFVNMFVDEAKLAAQLNHNNIIHIYDFGKIGNSYYIAMEYVEGHDLKDILKQAEVRLHPMPMELGMFVASKVGAALDYAHRKRDFEQKELGVVHRDVSPQNVLISDEGDIKLCDFGIAKATSKVTHTQAGALKGKLHYMSPEQAWGKPIDRRSDVFALATVLFEMLTGRRLFSGDNEISVLEQVREARVKAPSTLNEEVTTEIDRIALKALQREPEARYQTAGEMARDIDAVLYSFRPTPTSADLAIYLDRLYADQVGAAVVSEPAVSLPPPTPEPLRAPVAASIPAAAIPARTAQPESPMFAATAPARAKKRLAIPMIAAGLALAAVAVGAVVVLARRQPATAERASPTLATVAPTSSLPTRELPTPEPLPIANTTAPAQEIVPVVDTASDQALIDQEVRRRIAAERARIEQQRIQQIAADQAAQRRASEELAARQREQLVAEQRERELAAAAAAREAQQVPPPRVDEVSAQPVPTETATTTVESQQPAQPPSQQPQVGEAPPTPARQVREGDVVDPGTPGLVEPELIGLKKVPYPPIAKLQKVSGVVVINVLVSEKGRVLEARVLRGVTKGAALDEAALEMVKGATFRPATKDGVKVKAYKTMVVPFKL